MEINIKKQIEELLTDYLDIKSDLQIEERSYLDGYYNGIIDTYKAIYRLMESYEGVLR